MNRVLIHASKELERLKKKKSKSAEEIVQIFLDFSREGKHRDPVLLTVVRVPRSIAKMMFNKED